MISIFISLHNSISDSKIQHYSYITSTTSLALGILTGAIVLFSEVYYANLRLKVYQKRRKQRLEEKFYDNEAISLDEKGIFLFFEIICYVSLSVALISLTVYSIVSDIY